MSVLLKAAKFTPALAGKGLCFSSARALSSLRFTKSHEYVKLSGGIATVGISDHAANALGDVVFVELPATGKAYKAGDAFGSVESVKAASDVYAPIAGEVVETNNDLESAPETVNQSPFEDGWFIRLKASPEGLKEFEGLMDEKAYKKFLEQLEH